MAGLNPYDFREAPGSAGGKAPGFNPDTMSWDEYQRGQDEAFRRRAAIWQEEEDARNAFEDAAKLRAGGKLSGTWDADSAQSFTNPGMGFYPTGSGPGKTPLPEDTGPFAYQPPEAGYFERAQAELARQRADAQKFQKVVEAPSVPMTPTTDPGEYSPFQFFKDKYQEHNQYQKEMQDRAMSNIGRYLESGGQGAMLDPEVKDWMDEKAIMLGLGSGGIRTPKPGNGFIRIMTENPKSYQWPRQELLENQRLLPSRQNQLPPGSTVPQDFEMLASSVPPRRPDFVMQGQGEGPFMYPPSQLPAVKTNPYTEKPPGYYFAQTKKIPESSSADILSYSGPTPQKMSPQEILRDILYPAMANTIRSKTILPPALQKYFAAMGR